MLPGDGRRRRRRHSVVNCGCCPAWAAGRLPGAGQRVRGRPFYYGILFFFLVWRLLPGAGGRSPARRGAWGERGGCPSTPPAPPYSPFCGNAKAVPLAGLYLVRRVSRGRRREPSRPFRPGDVRACCGAPSALAGVRDRLRARAIAATVAWVEGVTLAGGTTGEGRRVRRASGGGKGEIPAGGTAGEKPAGRGSRTGGRSAQESDCVPAPFHPSDKSALGEGVGAWGRGNPLSREQRGFPLPQNDLPRPQQAAACGKKAPGVA